MLKKLLLLIIFNLLIMPVFAETISGNVRQDDFNEKKNIVFDSKTEAPIEGAKIYIPNSNFSTTTDSSGRFELNAQIEDKAILQIEKEGYRPFSVTIDKSYNDKSMRLGIRKTSELDAYIESGVFHLGDDVYSKNSANCGEFKAKPIGAYYSRQIKLKKPEAGYEAVIVFGSVIGLDTKIARELGQNKIASVYSSPLEVIFNGQKIGELHINGDNQKIIIPNSLIKPNSEIVIKTGKNLFQYKYTDYDDMEFANLRVEFQEKTFANKY